MGNWSENSSFSLVSLITIQEFVSMMSEFFTWVSVQTQTRWVTPLISLQSWSPPYVTAEIKKKKPDSLLILYLHCWDHLTQVLKNNHVNSDDSFAGERLVAVFVYKRWNNLITDINYEWFVMCLSLVTLHRIKEVKLWEGRIVMSSSGALLWKTNDRKITFIHIFIQTGNNHRRLKRWCRCLEMWMNESRHVAELLPQSRTVAGSMWKACRGERIPLSDTRTGGETAIFQRGTGV